MRQPRCFEIYSGMISFWDKWAPLVREQGFVTQALPMVTTGAGGPQHVSRGLLIATISTHRPHQLPRVLSVAIPLAQVRAGSAIYVDCPPAHLAAVFQRVLALGDMLNIRMGHSSRSPGSAPDAPRTRTEFHMPPSVTEFSVQMLLVGLRRQPWPVPVFFASRSIYADPAAPLLELTDPAALSKVDGFCREALYLKPKLVTIRTDVRGDDWQQRLDEIWATDPAVAVTRLRWRPSRIGGRALAAPAAARERVRAARQPAAARLENPGGGPCTAELMTEGSLGYDPQAAVSAIMRVVRQQTGVDLTAAASAAQLLPGSWRRLAADDPTADPGRVRLYFKTMADGAAVRAAIQGRAVQVGDDLVALRVETTAASAHSQNRRGGGRSAAAALPPQ